MRRIVNLFLRYAARHGRITKPGFALRDATGLPCGQIESIVICEGRITVTGWTLSDRVGLSQREQNVTLVPNRLRNDVRDSLGGNCPTTPGFSIEMPLGQSDLIFWTETTHTHRDYALPQITWRDRRLMQARLVIPFLRDAVRALPAALHWLRHRDALSVARVKAALRLNVDSRAGRLNALVFAADDAGPTKPPALSPTCISIIMPVHNAFHLLPEALRRLVNHTDLPWRLFLIEDCSTDDRVRPWLRNWKAGLPPAIAAKITLIENAENLGFIRSVNSGLAQALPFDDHVVILNSDALVPADWASRLIRPIVEQEGVATVTPMSNDAEIFSIPRIVQRQDLQPGVADAIDSVAALFNQGAVMADAPTGVGFCMAMNIAAIKQLPCFDTSFGRGYGEEVDWCQKARKLGWRHLGNAGLFVEHCGGTSFGSDEKQRLVQQNNAIIARRYPSYDAEVQTFLQTDPLHTPRLALAIAWAAQQQVSMPVYLAHDMGGGAENYLQDRLRADLKTGAAAIVLRLGGLSRWQIELHLHKAVLRGETDSTAFVARLLPLLQVRQIIYSCAVGDRDPVALPRIIASFATDPRDRIEVLFHDFLPLSPAYTLLDSDGIWRGVPMPGTTSDPAHDAKRPDGTNVTLQEWRSAWGHLMNVATELRVFSDSSRDLVTTAYPVAASKITVRPHSLLHPVSALAPVTAPTMAPHDPPVIGVLGNIGFHKGIGVLAALSQRLEKTRQAQLVVIGNVDHAYPLASSVRVHGSYRIADIPDLVARYGISRWFIPSIWPETFSYATHEALATGLPVYGFDLGAQGDSIRRAAQATGKGKVIPLTAAPPDPDAVLAALLG